MYNMYSSHSAGQTDNLVVRFQLVPEIHIICWLEDSQASTGLIKKWNFGGRVQKFHVEVRQHQTQELLDLIDGEKPARTFGDPRAKGHAVVTQPPATTVEDSFLLTLVIQETVILILLQGEDGRGG